MTAHLDKDELSFCWPDFDFKKELAEYWANVKDRNQEEPYPAYGEY